MTGNNKPFDAPSAKKKRKCFFGKQDDSSVPKNNDEMKKGPVAKPEVVQIVKLREISICKVPSPSSVVRVFVRNGGKSFQMKQAQQQQQQQQQQCEEAQKIMEKIQPKDATPTPTTSPKPSKGVIVVLSEPPKQQGQKRGRPAWHPTPENDDSHTDVEWIQCETCEK